MSLRLCVCLAALGALCVLAGCRPAAHPDPALASDTGVSLPSATSETADPAVGTVDGAVVTLSQVRDRLAQVPVTMAKDEAAATAAAMAAQDQLAIREMAVLHQAPVAGERPWQSADRFAHTVWTDREDCDADPGDIKLLYLQALTKFKHPSKWAVWDAQVQCCPDPDACPGPQLEACRRATQVEAEALAADMRQAQATLPPLGLAANATDVALDASPVKGARTDAFERVIASHVDKEPKWALRRYDFFQPNEPGFERGPFRPGEPAILGWVKTAKVGDISAPIATIWGWSVVQLVAREPTRQGKADPEILKRLTRDACADMAAKSRQNWRDGLLAGAQVKWNAAVIAQHFGPGVVEKLPRGKTFLFRNP